jgi:hypothetical protein
MTFSIARKCFTPQAAALALLCLGSAVALCPAVALADRHHEGNWHGGGHHGGYHHDNGQWRRGYERHDWRGGPVYQPYEVYAPAPVYYSPPPDPGINLFFPVHIR